MTAKSSPRTLSDWGVPAGLIFLSFVPVAAGTARVVNLMGAGAARPEDARFFASPAPITIHIAVVTVYCLLGAFQFSKWLRRNRPAWHRRAGRLLLPCGLVAAMSGIWMTLVYPAANNDNLVVYGFRLFFGAMMLASLVLGALAIRRRKFREHGAWMIRAYAVGLGAGTQVFTHLPWFIFVGTPGPTSRAVLMASGWLINWAVAEWIIRHPSRGGASPAPMMA